MKAAQLIATQAKDASDAMTQAEASAIAVDQNFTLEMTKWTFADNSILAVRDIDVFGIDADDEQSIKAYGDWVGADDPAEVLEVGRLLGALHE